MAILILIILLLAILSYFFIGNAPKAEKIVWGITFSQKYSQDLDLKWKENYLEILDDLKVKNIRLITHWDLIEKSPGEYDFEDLDWQIRESGKRGAKILLVIGLKTGRWPECHIPDWAKNSSKEDLKNKTLTLIKEIVLRYKDSKNIWAWQVENEPFFLFGECPKIEEKFVKQEINLVKSLDAPATFETEMVGGREIVVTDSGEGSFWFKVARLSDIPGITMYKKVWVKHLKSYFTYPLPSVFYWRKAQIIKKLFDKEVICTELQAEPWGPKLLYDISLNEQEKTMNLEQFQKNIEFAEKTGLKRFYLWGSEWWFWLKQKHNEPEIWDEAKKLF